MKNIMQNNTKKKKKLVKFGKVFYIKIFLKFFRKKGRLNIFNFLFIIFFFFSNFNLFTIFFLIDFKKLKKNLKENLKKKKIK